MEKNKALYHIVLKPALPALFCLAGFIIGAIAGLFIAPIGLGWGAIIGAVAAGIVGKFVQTMLSHVGL